MKYNKKNSIMKVNINLTVMNKYITKLLQSFITKCKHHYWYINKYKSRRNYWWIQYNIQYLIKNEHTFIQNNSYGLNKIE